MFASVVLGIEASYWLILRSWKTKRSVTCRLALSRQLANRAAVLNALRAERSVFGGNHPILKKLNDRWAQTGLQIDRGKLLLWFSALGAGLLLIYSAILGPGLTSFGAACVSTLGLIFLYLEMFARSGSRALPNCCPMRSTSSFVAYGPAILCRSRSIWRDVRCRILSERNSE